MKHLNIKIYGQVQGIFFRAGAKEQADKLGIVGFAQNQLDGSVYIEAEGKKKNLDEFLKWCHKGPSIAQVEKVGVKKTPLKNFKGFYIK